MLTKQRLIAALLAALTAALAIALVSTGKTPGDPASQPLAALSQTYIPVNPNAPLHIPQLVTTTNAGFGPRELQGRWSLIFFGYTACPLICPRTLSLLSAMARNQESGISSGITQAVFVSIDPEHDTPERMANYLHHFDRHIIGLTGTREAIRQFSHEIGAGYQPVGSTIDHSTSIFVVAPNGSLAGILLRPGTPSGILADLAKLRAFYER